VRNLTSAGSVEIFVSKLDQLQIKPTLSVTNTTICTGSSVHLNSLIIHNGTVVDWGYNGYK
jgi:hypothetical protein